MKRISLLLAVMCLIGVSNVRAQDAAIEERLNKLNGLVQDLIESKEQQRRQIAELSKQIETLREQTAKPSTDTATRDELQKLAESVKEVDRKRIEDSENVAKQFDKLAKVIADTSSNRSRPPRTPRSDDTPKSNPSGPDKGYEYEIQPGDTLLAISLAYREKGVKVSVDQILKANPNLKEKSLQVGQKIFIPAQ